jgi:hypothetical protein
MSEWISIEDLYRTDPLKACRLALSRTVNVNPKKRLERIDKLLGTCGTEAIRGEWQNGYWCDIVATYCNTGDSYKLTVMHIRGDYSGHPGHFRVTTVGDWVERNEKRLKTD